MMKTLAVLCLAGLSGMFVLLAAVARADTPLPADGDAEITIRGLDANPLRNTEVTLVATEDIPFTKNRPSTTVTTDDKGIAHFTWPGGSYQIDVEAKGIGYGRTGMVQIAAGQTARPALAPLVPYAHLTGTLPESLRDKGMTLRVADDWDRNPVILTPDGSGHYETDLKAGKFYFTVKRETASIAGAALRLDPGQTLNSPTLTIYPQAPGAATAPTSFIEQPYSKEPVIWAQGTLRNPAGKPIPNAKVYALGTYFGGIRMYETVSSTESDDQGHYELKGVGGLEIFSATLLATAPDHAPAWAWITGSDAPMELVPADTKPRKAPDGPTVDLILPTSAGTLKVTVLDTEGKPVANAGVSLWLEGANLRDTWAAGGGPEHDAVHHAAYPFEQTDADGIATFQYLLPGRYHIIAADADEQAVRGLHENYLGSPGDKAFNEAEGIPVRFNQTSALRLGIFVHPGDTRARLLKADGTPLSGENVPVLFGSVSNGGWSSSRKVENDGIAKLDFPTSGLWQAEWQYRDAPIQSFPISPPYYAAAGIMALSPSAPEFVPTWTARRFNLPSVTVHVLDAAGHPVRCPVTISQPQFAPLLMGSTDESGAVRFENVPLWQGSQIIASAILPDATDPLASADGQGPVPPDASLPPTFTLPAPVVREFNHNNDLTLRPRSVSWIRGSVKNLPKPDSTRVYVYVDPADAEPGASTIFDPKTGQYAAGPFTGKSATLGVYFQGPSGEARATLEIPVTPGQIIHADLTAAAPASIESNGNQVLFGMGGISSHATNAQRLDGKILLPDGKTPALGAMALLYEPDHPQPTYAGITDASGALRTRGLWVPQNNLPSDSADNPTTPVVVAFLPGQNGAVIVPLPKPGQPFTVTLPAAQSVQGSVTVAGVAPAKRPGQIRILAAYQGKGKLSAALSVQTTADLDGHFELAGLTPGTYLIQAALDDIWLSPAENLQVAAAPLQPIALAIPAPGSAVIIKLTDAAGKPAIARAVKIDRPKGLLDALWPAEWTSDGAGLVTVPTLEAGPQTLRIIGANITRKFDVPALPAKEPFQVDIRLP